MKKKLIVILLNCCIVVLLSRNVWAELKINEIYPAPEAGEFEWVEIYNDEDKSIDLTGFTITDATNKKLKLNVDNIAALGFVIATASSGVLNNNDGDTVILKNNSNEIIESIAYSGSFNAEKSYFRCPNGGGNWFISTAITKNSSNDGACNSLTPTPTSTPTPTITPTPHPSATPTLTPHPTITTAPTITLRPTIKIATISAINQPARRSASEGGFVEATPTAEVLGAKTKKNNILTILAVALSLLTITAVFLKMKMRHEKAN